MEEVLKQLELPQLGAVEGSQVLLIHPMEVLVVLMEDQLLHLETLLNQALLILDLLLAEALLVALVHRTVQTLADLHSALENHHHLAQEAQVPVAQVQEVLVASHLAVVAEGKHLT